MYHFVCVTIAVKKKLQGKAKKTEGTINLVMYSHQCTCSSINICQ